MKGEWKVNGVLEWMLWCGAQPRMEAGVQLSVGKESHLSPRAHPGPRSSLSPVTGWPAQLHSFRFCWPRL